MKPSATWRGLTIGGDGGAHRIQRIQGWEDLPGVRDMDVERPRAHGDFPGEQWAAGRAVTIEGVSVGDNLDALLLELQAATSLLSATMSDLTITSHGRTLTATGAVVRRQMPEDVKNGQRAFPWALQWQCPDPLRYAAAVTVSTGLPAAGGGLVYPLTDPLDYGTPGETGQRTLINGGTADAPLLFVVTGPLPSGFEISAAGQRITYPVAVPAGQVITIDTAAGALLVEGTSDRRSDLTSADWLVVPAGSTLTVQFTSLGGAYDPAATLTATVKAAVW